MTSNMDLLGKRNVTSELTEKVLRVPSLDAIMSPLIADVSQHEATLVKIINSRFDEIITDPRAREKIDRISLPFFVACWWPYATIDMQVAIALYHVWLFVWDDIFDGEDETDETTPKLNDIYGGSIDYVEYHLGLADLMTAEPKPPTPAAIYFKPVGEMFREHLELSQRKRLFEEIKFYIKSCALEQEYLDADRFPTMEQYWNHRWGTSAVFASCALAENAAGVSLSDEVFNWPEIRVLWIEVNRNIVIVNDMMSLKKEIHGSFQSLIPVIMADLNIDLDASVAVLVSQLQNSVVRFKDVAEKLLEKAGNDKVLRDELSRYIDVLEYNITGNLAWT